ncbi:hypothetical protein LSCM1_01220 [Leishmania martiniquensis]|uniref:PHD-type domain-containing protein n=1 Tax=Leishmania martiniquensis TaxID=1580590 RepID=A0A836GK81_9TRYP|nr:hypothetical protein LSCM1_01220 [Leishmania martiniquensis]
MPRAAKPAKRVGFGPITYYSSPPVEDSEGPHLHGRSSLLESSALHPWTSKSVKVETAAAVAAPLVHNEAGGHLWMDVPGQPAAPAALFHGAWGDGSNATLLSTQQATNVVVVGKSGGSDIQDLKAVSPQRKTPASSPASRLGSSDDDTYDTQVEQRFTERHSSSAAQCDGAGIGEPPSSFLERSPTMSQLVSAIDDVLGGSQRARSLLVATSFIMTPPCSSFVTECASLRLCATNPSLSSSRNAPKAQLADSSGTRVRGGADPQREDDESVTASRSPCRTSQSPIVSAVTLATSDTVSRNAQPTFCVFCGMDAPFGNAYETPLLCSDGIAYHTACALWCPEVFYDVELGALGGIAEASHRCHSIRCAWCRQPGAAVGCACPTCQLSFHVPCAVRARASMNMQTFVLYCPAHRSAA